MKGTSLLSGESLTLEAVVGEGGEAQVFGVAERLDLVVKLMHETPNSEVRQRWADMLSVKSPSENMNWPFDIWVDSTGNHRGLVLRRIKSISPIHGIYNPGIRIEKFPNATAKDLVKVALDLSRFVDRVHQMGWVVGDLNPTNVLLDKNLQIHIIDSDSIQMVVQDRTHACHVGHPLYLAPEWQGQRLRDSHRAPSSDVFSLAVQVYHLLHFGRHPFAGTWQGEGESPTVEEAITAGWYVHGINSPLRPPIMALSPMVWGDQLVQLFLSSFAIDPDQRPSSRDWMVALDAINSEMESSACGVLGHSVRSTLDTCCWCEFAIQGVDLFGREVPWQDASALDKTIPTLHALLGMLQPREVPRDFEFIFGRLERPQAPFFSDWHWRPSQRRALAHAREDAWQDQLDDWIEKRDAWNRQREEVITENERRRQQRKKVLQARALVEEMRELTCRRDVRLRFELSLVQVKLEPRLVPGIGPWRVQQLREAGLSNAMLLSKRTLRHVEGIGYDRTLVLLEWRQRLLRSISESEVALSKRHSKGIVADLCKDVLKAVALLERNINA